MPFARVGLMQGDMITVEGVEVVFVGGAVWLLLGCGLVLLVVTRMV